MRCFSCDRSITIDNLAVHGATIWHSYGNYGSRMYDSLMEDTHLEIAICDDCLSARRQNVEEVLTVHRVEETARRPAELS